MYFFRLFAEVEARVRVPWQLFYDTDDVVTAGFLFSVDLEDLSFKLST